MQRSGFYVVGNQQNFEYQIFPGQNQAYVQYPGPVRQGTPSGHGFGPSQAYVAYQPNYGPNQAYPPQANTQPRQAYIPVYAANDPTRTNSQSTLSTEEDGSHRIPTPQQDQVLSAQPTFSALRKRKTVKVASLAPPLGKASQDSTTTLSENVPGTSVSLQKNIELYRQSAKSSNDLGTQFEFAKFCIESADNIGEAATKDKLIDEGFTWLRKLAASGFPEAQYYLGQAYAHDKEYGMAFAQFVSAAKKFHAGACFATAQAYENGYGVKKSKRLAMEYYNKAANAGHKPALFRLGIIYLQGDLDQKVNFKDSVKYLKRCAAVADKENPESLYQLHLIYENGLLPEIHADINYSRSTLLEAVKLGYAPACHKLGECYKNGSLTFPAASLKWYREAARLGYPASQYHLSGWYLSGIPGILAPSEVQAYEFASQAAVQGHGKACYALGYFYENGIGCQKDPQKAREFYVLAAKQGEENARLKVAVKGDSKKDKDCRIM